MNYRSLILVFSILTFVACGDKEDDAQGNYQPSDIVETIDVASLCPDQNHPHIIDMGNAGKWACCNIGAASPEQTGNYYSWGETEESQGLVSDYQYFTSGELNEAQGVDIGTDISGTEYDVARAKWGEFWSMPTLSMVKKLEKCKWKWVQVNEMEGMLVTAGTGGKLFLPAAGKYMFGDMFGTYQREGWYMSSALNEGHDSNRRSYPLYFDRWEGPDWHVGAWRSDGLPVRAVYVGE